MNASGGNPRRNHSCLLIAPTGGGNTARPGTKEEEKMHTMSLSEPDYVVLKAVWTTRHPTVRQRLLEVLAALAVKRLTEVLAEPIDKEVVCLP